MIIPDKAIPHLIGFFSFLVLPFSFISGAMDQACHLRFFIWSLLSLGLGLWVFTRKETRQGASFVSMAHQRIFWAGGVFLLISAFSLFRCVNLAEGFFSWLSVLLAGAFLFLCSQILYQYPNGVLILSHWAVAAGFGFVALGTAGSYWNSALSSPFFFHGIMVNKNLYASSLFLILPFVVHCLVSGRKIGSWAAAILLPALCITILLSCSRAVWLALVFAAVPVALLAFYSPFKCREKGKIVKSVVKKGAMLALPILSLVWVCLFLYPSVKNSETVQLRLNLWNRTVQMIFHVPLFGVGPGQWRLVLPEYGQPLVANGSGGNVETIAQRPHNDFLWVAAETGILGATCYLVFLCMLYYYAVKVVTRADPGQKTLVLSMVYGISGYLIVAFFFLSPGTSAAQPFGNAHGSCDCFFLPQALPGRNKRGQEGLGGDF